MKGRAFELSVCEECVCEGHSHSRPAAGGFSNDRVDFSELTPVITHDPFVLRFSSLHPSPKELTASKKTELLLFHQNVPLSMPRCKEMSIWTDLNTATPFFCSLLLSHPASVHSSPLSFTVPFFSFYPFFTLSSRTSILSDTLTSQDKSAVNVLPLIFFFFY